MGGRPGLVRVSFLYHHRPRLFPVGPDFPEQTPNASFLGPTAHPVSQTTRPNRPTPIESLTKCLTQTVRQIRDPWYHYVRVPCETEKSCWSDMHGHPPSVRLPVWRHRKES